MEDVYNRGRRIRVNSYRSGMRWSLDVRVATLNGPRQTERLLVPSTDWTGAIKEEADQYGLAMARSWIDRNG